jgi:hypothetical protein
LSDTPDDNGEQPEHEFMAVPFPLSSLFGGLRMAPSQEAIDRHHMAMEEKHARFKRFFSEVSVEHLATFSQLMSDLAHMEDAEGYAAYLQGRAEAVLEHVHGVCGHCGVDHDTEILTEAIEGETE